MVLRLSTRSRDDGLDAFRSRLAGDPGEPRGHDTRLLELAGADLPTLVRVVPESDVHALPVDLIDETVVDLGDEKPHRVRSDIDDGDFHCRDSSLGIGWSIATALVGTATRTAERPTHHGRLVNVRFLGFARGQA